MFDVYFFWRSIALRPTMSSSFDVVDESFSQWKQPIVQQALSQVTFDVKCCYIYIYIYKVTWLADFDGIIMQ
jgi:hypothetical protein